MRLPCRIGSGTPTYKGTKTSAKEKPHRPKPHPPPLQTVPEATAPRPPPPGLHSPASALLSPTGRPYIPQTTRHTAHRLRPTAYPHKARHVPPACRGTRIQLAAPLPFPRPSPRSLHGRHRTHRLLLRRPALRTDQPHRIIPRCDRQGGTASGRPPRCMAKPLPPAAPPCPPAAWPPHRCTATIATMAAASSPQTAGTPWQKQSGAVPFRNSPA